MTWNYRPGYETKDSLLELEKTLGIENLKDIPIETEFPAAGPEETSLHIVSSSGIWLVLLTSGARYRVQLSSF